MIHKKKEKTEKGLYTIPAIRRAFEHIETFVDKLISDKESDDKIAKALQKEWHTTFLKPLSKNSATEFVKQRVSNFAGSKHRTLRRKGGSTVLSGAPLNSSMGPGLFLAPNSPPDSAGHLPLSNGHNSSYGSFVDYITNGFKVPDMGSKSGYVQGQPLWPIPSMFGGKRGLKTKTKTKTKAKTKSNVKSKSRSLKNGIKRGGGIFDTAGTLISQAIMHPIPSLNPSSISQDAQGSYFGIEPSISSDQVQRHVNYQMGAVYPKPVSF